MYQLGKFSQVISDFETIHFASAPREKYDAFVAGNVAIRKTRMLARIALIMVGLSDLSTGVSAPKADARR